MPTLYTEIQINAPRSRVWQILYHKEKWKYWNTFLYDCNPNQLLIPGEEVSLSLIRVPGNEEVQFRPLVTLVQPEVCLQWRSTLPGLHNEHIWELQDVDRDRTKFVYQQLYSGPISRFFLSFIRTDEQMGMRRMSQELKRYVESD